MLTLSLHSGDCRDVCDDVVPVSGCYRQLEWNHLPVDYRDDYMHEPARTICVRLTELLALRVFLLRY